MIKNIKFFLNGNKEILQKATLLKEEMQKNDFITTGNIYDLIISIGDTKLFNNVLKVHGYSEKLEYCFLHPNELSEENIKELIYKIKTDKYSMQELQLMRLKMYMGNYLLNYLATNKIIISNPDLENINIDVYLNDILFERYNSSGMLLLKNDLLVQILPISLDQNLNKRFELLSNDKKLKINFEPKDIIISIDGDTKYIGNLSEIKIENDIKKIKCIKL